MKSHLFELVSRVHGHHERVTVTAHGRPSAVLIAPEDLERLEETLEIMRDVAMMIRETACIVVIIAPPGFGRLIIRG